MTGKTLDSYIPAWARPSRDGVKGPSMVDTPLDPVRDWRILRFVGDEEGLQNRAMHFLFSFVGLRGAITPEICHPKWNCFKRAYAAAGMDYDVLRLTIACNYSHGTKLTGERATDRKQFLSNYLRKQSRQYFMDLKDEILLDRGIPCDSVDAGDMDPQLLLEEFLECPSICKKGQFVPSLNSMIPLPVLVFRLLFFSWPGHTLI